MDLAYRPGGALSGALRLNLLNLFVQRYGAHVHEFAFHVDVLMPCFFPVSWTFPVLPKSHQRSGCQKPGWTTIKLPRC